MSADPSQKFLQQSARHGHLSENGIIMTELNRLSTRGEWEPSSCTMQDIGDYLTKTAAMLSELAQNVVNSDDVDNYGIKRVQEAMEYNQLSELSVVSYLTDKHNSLKYAPCPGNMRTCN